MVYITNTSKLPQQLERVWLAPKEQRQFNFPVALKYHDDNRFDINFTKEDLTPSLDEQNNLLGITFRAPVSIADGYGQGTVFMATGLLSRGIDVDLYAKGWLNNQGLPKPIQQLLVRQKRGYEFGVARGYPDEVIPKLPAGAFVANTMWESSVIPQHWVEFLNRAEAVIVPCEAQIPMFKGVRKPFYTVPEPVDIDYWSERTVLPTPGIFKIVSWARMSSRKMPMEMIQVFSYAFPADKYPHVRFELKTTHGQFGAGDNLIPRFRDSRIIVHNGVWSLDRLRDWVSSASAGLFLSRGEGMFVPPMQAMALGVPVVVANHTGPSDYADERYNFPVQLDKKTPLLPSPQGDGMQWWNPDLEHAVYQLRKLYEDYEGAQKRALRAQEMVEERYSIDAVADKLIRVLERHA